MRLRLATMPSPLDSLRAEHALLREALVVLESIGQHVGAGRPFPGTDCALVLRYLREFVGGVHSRKETAVVFPAVAMYGGDQAAEQIGELLLAQDQADELLHTLVLFWEPVGELTDGERRCFAETARAFHTRMMHMLAIEEQRIFALAEAEVPVDDRLSWLQEFTAIAAERPQVSELETLLREVAQRWLGKP